MRTRFFVLAAFIAGCLGACIIGPKQEDPAATGVVNDASFDDDARVADDTSTAPAVETGESADGAGGGLFNDAAASDAIGDAVGDARDAADGALDASSDAPDGG